MVYCKDCKWLREPENGWGLCELTRAGYGPFTEVYPDSFDGDDNGVLCVSLDFGCVQGMEKEKK